MANCGLDQNNNLLRRSFSWYLESSFFLCAAVDHSLPAPIESAGALGTPLVLVHRTFSLSGFPAFFFHLSVIHVWPWLSTQGNACSDLSEEWERIQMPQGPKKVSWLLLVSSSTGMSYQDVVFSNLSSLFQLFPKIQFCPLQPAWPDITCWVSQSCLT